MGRHLPATKQIQQRQQRPLQHERHDLVHHHKKARNWTHIDRMIDTTGLTSAEDSSKWDAMESDLISNRLKQPARPRTPVTTTTTTQPTTHDQTKARLKLTTKKKTTLKTTTSKTTTIRSSSSHNQSTVEPPLQQQPHQSHSFKKKSSNQGFE